MNKSSINPIAKNPIDSTNKIWISPIPKLRSLLKFKKTKEENKPIKILNPPIRGSGILDCFLSSEKSRKFFLILKFIIKGNEIRDVKKDIKNEQIR